MRREVWLKVENLQQYTDNEQKIMKILKKYNLENNNRVVVFDEKCRNIKELKRGVDINAALIQELTIMFGKDAVKVTEKEDYDTLAEEFAEVPGEDMEAIEFMKIKRLDRIADALENIAFKLDALDEIQEDLDSCIGYIPPARYAPPGTKGCNFFRIGGNVWRD